MFSKFNNVSIVGISTAVPKKKFFNKDYIYASKESNDKFIKNTGIYERRISNKNICTSDLVIAAAEKIIKTIPWKKKTIEAIILVTQTPDYLTPSTSIKIQNELDLPKNIIAFDINLGCSGFSYGLSIISSIMNNLSINRSLLLVGDVLSRLCNIKDKSTWPVFGDAGSAIALEKKKKNQFSFFNFFSDGSGYSDIIVPSHSLSGKNIISNISFKEKRYSDGIIKSDLNLFLNGPNVYSFAINNVHLAINDLIAESKINNKYIKYFFLHQANKMINDKIKSKLNFPNSFFPQSLKKFGNTSAASIPLTINLENNKKEINDYCLLSGFGVGISMCNAIIKINKIKTTKLLEI